MKWTVRDDNDDQMVYSVYYRGDGETRWLLLKDNLTDKFYSFDASLLPDGGYTIEVVASDAPSHSPGQALTSSKDSARFEVDTTPPRIDDLKASVEGEQIHVVFNAADGFSNIKRAEYSVDAGDWQYVEPVGQLADSKTASYDFQAAIPAAANSSRSAQAKDIGRACGSGQSLRPLRQHEFREDGDSRQVTRGDSRPRLSGGAKLCGFLIRATAVELCSTGQPRAAVPTWFLPS